MADRLFGSVLTLCCILQYLRDRVIADAIVPIDIEHRGHLEAPAERIQNAGSHLALRVAGVRCRSETRTSTSFAPITPNVECMVFNGLCDSPMFPETNRNGYFLKKNQ
jgi:hypothetical protein